MVRLTDGEPKPRAAVFARKRTICAASLIDLPRAIESPSIDFFEVLSARRSGLGATLPLKCLSSLLWHSMCLRERRQGRFGIEWESRSAPSAGGLHPIRLLVLPVDGGEGGIYDDHRHALVPVEREAQYLNRASIEEILGVLEGTTIQFAVDAALVDACYENSSSLIWRDAGALTATICLLATALGLAATPVGRVGNAIVQAASLLDGFVGVGAVHVSTLIEASPAGYLKDAEAGAAI